MVVDLVGLLVVLVVVAVSPVFDVFPVAITAASERFLGPPAAQFGVRNRSSSHLSAFPGGTLSNLVNNEREREREMWYGLEHQNFLGR